MQTTSATAPARRLTLAMPRMPWSALPVAAVTVLAGVLRLVSLAGTQTNPYYDAAIRSMSQSWHNFFFAAFEPGASVSIDKPPLDLWLQVASVKLFGWSTTALLLPEALAATLAVPLLYAVVRRLFGVAAGITSALALAVLPISVMTARSDTMDSLMMALSVLAAWLVVRAAETDRGRYLFLAAAVMGLNFEVKLFEALLALPALVVLYALAARTPPLRRAGALAASLAIFLVVAVAWPAAVSLAPASSRPYAIGSTNGSVWNAIFVFNGTDRINPPSSSRGARSNAPRAGSHPGVRAPTGPSRPTAAPARAAPPRAHATGAAAAPRPPPAARRTRHRATAAEVQGQISGSGEPPSLKRLFTLRGYFYGQNLGVELAGAILFGGLALLAAALALLERLTAARRERLAAARASASEPGRAGGTSAATATGTSAAAAFEPSAGRLARAGAIAFTIWLVTGFAVFSHVRGVLHPRYLEAMTPAVAVGLGAGVVACTRLAAARVAALLAFLAALALAVRYAIAIAGSDTTLTAVVITTGVLGAAAAVAARVLRGRGTLALGAAAAAAALSLTSLLAPAVARSALIARSKAQDAGSPGAEPAAWVRRVSAYLRSHAGRSRYEFAAASYGQAGALIVHDGRPVMVLTGFARRPIVKLATLERAARRGEVRYAVLNDQCGRADLSALGPCPKTEAWIREHSVDVTADVGLADRRGVVFRLTP